MLSVSRNNKAGSDMACFSVWGDAASLPPLPLCCMRRERATDQLHFRAARLRRGQQNRLSILTVTKISHSSRLCQLRAPAREREKLRLWFQHKGFKHPRACSAGHAFFARKCVRHFALAWKARDTLPSGSAEEPPHKYNCRDVPLQGAPHKLAERRN